VLWFLAFAKAKKVDLGIKSNMLKKRVFFRNLATKEI